MEDVLCVLSVLCELELDPAVASAASGAPGVAARRPAVGVSVEALRQHRPREPAGAAVGTRPPRLERPHLLALYAPLVRCVRCEDARVREALTGALAAAGRELGLLPVGLDEDAGAEAAGQ